MACDASGWKTVYHTKRTEEQRGTITKHYETIKSGVTGETPETGSDKTVSSPPEARKTAPMKTIHTKIFSEDVKVSSPYDRGFFERLISECESFGKEGKGAERIIKVELSDGKTVEGEDPRRRIFEESSKKSGEEENVNRYVYKVTSSIKKGEEKDTKGEIIKESSGTANDDLKENENGIKKSRHVQWDDEKTTDKVNKTTDARERINYANLNEESKEKPHWNGSYISTEEIPIYQRKTYKDWAIFKEKLLKEFEDVPKSKNYENSPPQNSKTGGNPPPIIEKPLKELEDSPKTRTYENSSPPKSKIGHEPSPTDKKPEILIKTRSYENHHPLNSKNHVNPLTEATKPEVLTEPKSQRTRCILQKQVHAVTDDWQLNKQLYLDFGVEECKQLEQQMAGNLKEIREIVQDVRKLSQKFPKVLESGGETQRETVKLKTSLNAHNISSPNSNDGVVYVTEIKFPVNGHGYKPQRTTAI